jgi:hypothetical protein
MPGKSIVRRTVESLKNASRKKASWSVELCIVAVPTCLLHVGEDIYLA